MAQNIHVVLAIIGYIVVLNSGLPILSKNGVAQLTLDHYIDIDGTIHLNDAARNDMQPDSNDENPGENAPQDAEKTLEWYVIPSIAAGVFFLLCLGTCVGVAVYQRKRPAGFQPQYLDSDPPERTGSLWVKGADEKTDEAEPGCSTGELGGIDNQTYEFDEPVCQSDIDGTLDRSTTLDVYEELEDPGATLAEPEVPPCEPDPYMTELEMSPIYTQFNANVTNIPREASFAIARPKIKPVAERSNSDGSHFSGAELEI